MRARRADDVILINAVTADADRAEEHSIAILSKGAGKIVIPFGSSGFSTGAGFTVIAAGLQ
jgi:hypothetical protein